MATKKEEARSYARVQKALRGHKRQKYTHPSPEKGPRPALGLTMPRRHRLSRRDFEVLGRSPRKRIGGTYFFLTLAPSPGGAGIQSACVVSKKVSPRANVRNRIKRRCRDIVRKILFPASFSGALLFTAKREASGASHAEMKADIERLLQRMSG